MDTYNAFVLDDYEDLRDLIVDCAQAPDFHVRGYSQAEKVLADINDPCLPNPPGPDVLVVDLQLEAGKMQGIQLVAELFERDIASEILVITGEGSAEDLEKAVKMGATIMRKPFDNIFDLAKKMRFMAETSRKRRSYMSGMDSSRFSRPVFLSYAKEDLSFARGIRRNFEARRIPVWYAPSSLSVGDAWRQRIEEGLSQANVFIPIITDSYIASHFCRNELARFYSRTESNVEPRPVILPVLAGLSQDGKTHDLVRPIIGNFQYIDLSRLFLQGFTALLGQVQRVLREQPRADSQTRVARIAS